MLSPYIGSVHYKHFLVHNTVPVFVAQLEWCGIPARESFPSSGLSEIETNHTEV